MTWTHIELSTLPQETQQLLPGAIACAWTALGRRYRVEGGEIRVNWGAPFHHSTLPTVIALDSVLDRAAAVRFHAGVRLTRVFDRTPTMDGAEKRLLAAVGGLDLDNMSSGVLAERFTKHLFALLEHASLRQFFEIQPRRLDHYDVRPVERLTLARRAKALNAVDRLLLVTICGLYNSGLAADAFKRTWNPPAVDAFTCMNALRQQNSDLVAHWYGLLAAYPGW
jgi:hypothetical protein